MEVFYSVFVWKPYEEKRKLVAKAQRIARGGSSLAFGVGGAWAG